MIAIYNYRSKVDLIYIFAFWLPLSKIFWTNTNSSYSLIHNKQTVLLDSSFNMTNSNKSFSIYMTAAILFSCCVLSVSYYFSGACLPRRDLNIGDLPVGAGMAMATPDKERNLSTRNQNVMNKELFTIMKPVHDA